MSLALFLCHIYNRILHEELLYCLEKQLLQSPHCKKIIKNITDCVTDLCGNLKLFHHSKFKENTNASFDEVVLRNWEVTEGELVYIFTVYVVRRWAGCSLHKMSNTEAQLNTPKYRLCLSGVDCITYLTGEVQLD